MQKDGIFDLLRSHLVTIVPHINEADVTPDASMRELGANSLDRADVIIECLQSLQLKCDLMNFQHATSLAQVVDLLYELQQRSGEG